MSLIDLIGLVDCDGWAVVVVSVGWYYFQLGATTVSMPSTQERETVDAPRREDCNHGSEEDEKCEKNQTGVLTRRGCGGVDDGGCDENCGVDMDGRDDDYGGDDNGGGGWRPQELGSEGAHGDRGSEDCVFISRYVQLQLRVETNRPAAARRLLDRRTVHATD